LIRAVILCGLTGCSGFPDSNPFLRFVDEADLRGEEKKKDLAPAPDLARKQDDPPSPTVYVDDEFAMRSNWQFLCDDEWKGHTIIHEKNDICAGNSTRNCAAFGGQDFPGQTGTNCSLLYKPTLDMSKSSSRKISIIIYTQYDLTLVKDINGNYAERIFVELFRSDSDIAWESGVQIIMPRSMTWMDKTVTIPLAPGLPLDQVRLRFHVQAYKDGNKSYWRISKVHVADAP
jgi:hypothetical protein